MARVELTADAVQDLRDLDGTARRLVLRKLKGLETDPDQRGAPLVSNNKGNLTTFRKLVVGNHDYRIIYRVDPDGTVVVVWVIAHRADSKCYDLAASRLRLAGDPGLAESAGTLLDEAWHGHRRRD